MSIYMIFAEMSSEIFDIVNNFEIQKLETWFSFIIRIHQLEESPLLERIITSLMIK